MNKSVYESCSNCANINICSGPDYIGRKASYVWQRNCR